MENSESDGVGRARRLRAVLPTRLRAGTPGAIPAAVPEGPEVAESMTERALRLVAAHIGDYPSTTPSAPAATSRCASCSPTARAGRLRPLAHEPTSRYASVTEAGR